MVNLSNVPPPAWLIFAGTVIGALVAAVGTLWMAHWTAARNAASSERQRTANEQILHKSEQISELQESLRVAQEKANTTYSGGDSFCYVDIYPTLDSSDPFAMHFVLRHVGETMVYDIVIQLLDMKGPGFDTDEKFEISTLARGETRALTALKIKPLQVDMYGVRIRARNGRVSQDIVITRVKNRWLRSLKVFVTPDHDHAMSRETQEAIAAAINQQSVAVGGKDVKVHFDVVDGGRVKFERIDVGFPK